MKQISIEKNKETIMPKIAAEKVAIFIVGIRSCANLNRTTAKEVAVVTTVVATKIGRKSDKALLLWKETI